MAKPTIIFCSGAWHTAFHIKPVIPFFEQSGYKILPAPLLAAGNKVTTDEVIDHIKKTAEDELTTGADICLILHSAAGLLGTEAVNRLLNNHSPDRISIIYIGSFFDMPALIDHLLANNLIHVDMEQRRTTAARPKDAFFAEMSPEEAEPYIKELTFQCATKVEFSSEAWRGVRKGNVVVDGDVCVPVELQERLTGLGMREVRMGGGHCPFVTRPGEFVRVVDGVLREL